MSPNGKRGRWLGGALVLTLAASAYTWQHDRATQSIAAPDIVEPVAAHVAPSHPTEEPTVSVPSSLAGRALPDLAGDPFGIKATPGPEQTKVAMPMPPAAPPMVVQPPGMLQAPPPPAPPPLPFTYFGKLGDARQYTVFVTAHGKNYAVNNGDVVAQFYRVEEIRPPTMTWVYLPLNTKQTMQIGETN